MINSTLKNKKRGKEGNRSVVQMDSNVPSASSLRVILKGTVMDVLNLN